MATDTNFSDYNELRTLSYFVFVRCQSGDNTVVLKALRPEYREKKQYQDDLKKEYNIGKKMDHTGLAKYLDFVDDETYGPCIVLEELQGRTLKEYAKERHSFEEKEAIVNQIANALEYIHNQGEVHGGINQDNVFICNQNNQVKLLNFRTITSLERVDFESVKFIAPEAKDTTVSIDERADIYSLGIVMKELGLNVDCEAIFKKCTALGRNMRYASAGEFLEDFNRDEPLIQVNKKVVFSTLAVLILGALCYFVYAGGYLNNISFSMDSDDTEVTDTVSTSTISPDAKPVAKADTTAQKPAQNTIDAVVKAGLDSIFTPYEEKVEGISKWELQGLRVQIKNYYRQLTKEHADLDASQKQLLDETFQSYSREKQGALTIKPSYGNGSTGSTGSSSSATSTSTHTTGSSASHSSSAPAHSSSEKTEDTSAE